MGNKNHCRYKLRKAESRKHSPKTRFSEPTKLIRDWCELDGLETDKYIIEVNHEMCSGYLRSKIDKSDYMYLSSHTFYGSAYMGVTAYLREHGFNIQLENWDGATIYSI